MPKVFVGLPKPARAWASGAASPGAAPPELLEPSCVRKPYTVRGAADRLVELQGNRAHLEAEWAPGRRSDRTRPPFMAAQLGIDAETVIRWLLALVVLLIDPMAVVLTIAVSRWD